MRGPEGMDVARNGEIRPLPGSREDGQEPGELRTWGRRLKVTDDPPWMLLARLDRRMTVIRVSKGFSERFQRSFS